MRPFNPAAKAGVGNGLAIAAYEAMVLFRGDG